MANPASFEAFKKMMASTKNYSYKDEAIGVIDDYIDVDDYIESQLLNSPNKFTK